MQLELLGQGYDGASGRGGPHYPQGGGGGAGGPGQNARDNDNAGNGGIGLVNPFGRVTQVMKNFGNNSYWLAGGGGGGVENSARVGRGGLGGGGIGGRQNPNTDPSLASRTLVAVAVARIVVEVAAVAAVLSSYDISCQNNNCHRGS